MSYDYLVSFLMFYLEVDNAKTVFFDFAVNKHGMSSTNIYNQLKKQDTILDMEKEIIKLLHGLLDIKEKSVYVNECEVTVVKSEELESKKVSPELKNPNKLSPIVFKPRE